MKNYEQNQDAYNYAIVLKNFIDYIFAFVLHMYYSLVLILKQRYLTDFTLFNYFY